MPLWFQTETRVRTHQKMLAAGRQACWTWVCGNCYAKDQMTDGFIPEGMLSSLVPSVPLREIKKDAERLVASGLWKAVPGGYQIHDYLEYNESKAAILAKQEEDRLRKQRGKSKEIPDGTSADADGIPFSISTSPSGSEKDDREPKPHPIRDLLTYHQQCFIAKHGRKPAKYTAKDAKHAKDLIDPHGFDGAKAVIRQAFISRDSFIANSGHSMGVIVSSAVQNRLITELSAKKSTAGLESSPEHPHQRKLREMGVANG